MTPEQLRRVPMSAIAAERSRRSLAYFVRASWPVLEPETPLLWNWHHEAICFHVQRMLENWAKRKAGVKRCGAETRNLVINVPPGSAKSRIVSVCATAWAWLHWPGFRSLCLSANPDVAIRDSVYCRDLICSEWYQKLFQPPWMLAEDQNAKGKFRNTKGGERTAKGITAKITGSRADAILIDDANDAKEAFNERARKAVNDAWDTGLWNRVNDPQSSIRIGIAQRLHEDDWSGHVLGDASKSDTMGAWDCLSIAMEYCAENAQPTRFGWSDPRSEEGELMHPERYPEEVLKDERRVLGSMGYSAQMNQDPEPEGGVLFKRNWWRFYGPQGYESKRPRMSYPGPPVPRPLRFDQVVISVDANFKKTEGGSRVSMLVIGGVRADRYLLDNITGPMGFRDTLRNLLVLHDRYPDARRILIEDKANGPAIVDVLRSEVPGIIEVNPQGGKYARAAAVQPTVESHNVYLPEGEEWVDPFVSELAKFPGGKYDDQVDSFSQALIHMHGGADLSRALALCQF